MTDKVVNQVLILALMMGLGIFLRKRGVFNDAVRKGMADLLIYVTMPLMVIAAFNFPLDSTLLHHAGAVFLASTLIHLVLILVSRVLFLRFDADRQRVLRFATVFSNCGFVGLPVVQGLYGDIGVFYASIFNLPFNILIWSWGVALFSGERKFGPTVRALAVNIPLLSIVVGFLIFLFSIHLPYPIQKTCEGVGAMTTPLSMFIIGSMLADVHPRDIFRGLDVYYVAIIKLIIAPLLCLLAFKALHVDRTLTGVCVALIAMPTASIIGVFAERYNSNAATASRCAFLTTILSLLTLPLILSCL